MWERIRGILLRQIVSDVRDKRFGYVPRKKMNRDWGKYDRAQCYEVVEVLDLIKNLVDSAYLNVQSKLCARRGAGRPRKALCTDVAKALLAQSYFGVSNRNTEGYLILFSDRLGLSSDFSYKTIERGNDEPDVKVILDEVLRLSNIPVYGREKTVSVDGTGFPTSVKQNYESDRNKQKQVTARPEFFPNPQIMITFTT